MKQSLFLQFAGYFIKNQPFYLRVFMTVFILWGGASLSVAQTFDDSTDLEKAIEASSEGGEFVVAAGSYDGFGVNLQDIVATEDAPIIIRAEMVGGVTLTGDSDFRLRRCAHIIIEGFIFDCDDTNTLVKLEGCNNIRITRNVFEIVTESSAKWVYVGGVWDDDTEPYQSLSHHNRIDHNIFQNKATAGHYITIDGTNEVVQSQFDRIDHNYFKNNTPRADNEKESIRVGWSNMSQSSGFTTVEYNLFENCDGDPEIVSIKSCDNIVRHNTFVACYGTLSLRHGNRNVVDGNFFFGGGKEIGLSESGSTLYTGGIRIYGTDHVITNNYMQDLTGTKWDAPITLTLGDAIDGESSSLSKHFRAERVLIANNTLVNNSHGIEIGYDNQDSYSKDLSEIVIANNLITGSQNAMVEVVDTDNDQGENITWINNLMYPTGDAVLLEGASATSFSEDMVKVENPFLEFSDSDTMWYATEQTPLYTGYAGVESDMNGQLRADNNNPGADVWSQDSTLYCPMNSETVGPFAYETDDEKEMQYVIVSSLESFTAEGGEQSLTITSNTEWSVACDADWVALSASEGVDNGMVAVQVVANDAYVGRSAVLVVSAADMTRTIEVSQDGLVLTNFVTPLSAVASTEQEGNTASNTIDNDTDSRWSGEGLGAYIIYEFDQTYEFDIVSILTTSKVYLYEIWISTDGENYEQISSVQSNDDKTYADYPVNRVAKYIKIVGQGQETGSLWNSIYEIKFYGDPSTSNLQAETNDLLISFDRNSRELKVANESSRIQMVTVYTISGSRVFEKVNDQTGHVCCCPLSNLSSGNYITKVSLENGTSILKKFCID